MRRKRFQKGSLLARKHGCHRVWVAFWREDGVRRCKTLGHQSEMSKGQAEAALSDLLREINAKAQAAKPVYTFEQFVERVYLPFCRRTWKASTEGVSEQIIKAHLTPELGSTLLREIGREQLQDILDSKGKGRSESIVAHCRWFLNAIFKLALSDGLVKSNPAAALRIPKKCQDGRAVRPLMGKEVVLYLNALDLRERLIARLAIFEGMRPGEILALRWKAVAGEAVQIAERVYRGVLDTPKNGKFRQGALSDGTLALLKEWSGFALNPAPDGFVFPSERIVSPISRDNIWRRHMQPKLTKVGLGWASFQVLRKTNATLAQKAGVAAKVAADQRGHGVGVSLDVYTISDLEQKRAAVRMLEASLSA